MRTLLQKCASIFLIFIILLCSALCFINADDDFTLNPESIVNKTGGITTDSQVLELFNNKKIVDKKIGDKNKIFIGKIINDDKKSQTNVLFNNPTYIADVVADNEVSNNYWPELIIIFLMVISIVFIQKGRKHANKN